MIDTSEPRARQLRDEPQSGRYPTRGYQQRQPSLERGVADQTDLTIGARARVHHALTTLRPDRSARLTTDSHINVRALSGGRAAPVRLQRLVGRRRGDSDIAVPDGSSNHPPDDDWSKSNDSYHRGDCTQADTAEEVFRRRTMNVATASKGKRRTQHMERRQDRMTMAQRINSRGRWPRSAHP